MTPALVFREAKGEFSPIGAQWPFQISINTQEALGIFNFWKGEADMTGLLGRFNANIKEVLSTYDSYQTIVQFSYIYWVWTAISTHGSCSLALFTGAGPESCRLKAMNFYCFPPKSASLRHFGPSTQPEVLHKVSSESEPCTRHCQRSLKASKMQYPQESLLLGPLKIPHSRIKLLFLTQTFCMVSGLDKNGSVHLSPKVSPLKIG